MGPRGQPLTFGKQPEFDAEKEVYRIHFYPKTNTDKDEYVLFKVNLFQFFINFSTTKYLIKYSGNWPQFLVHNWGFEITSSFREVLEALVLGKIRAIHLKLNHVQIILM